MAQVIFDATVGGDGSTVSDDASPSTGLANGGHRSRLVPAFAQIVAVATWVKNRALDVLGYKDAAAASATAASNSATAAANSATAAAASYDSFDDRYLGPKASDPATDNDGNPLLVGAEYFNTAINRKKVWNGTAWELGYTLSGDYVLAASLLWLTKTAAYTAVANDLIDANTTAGSFAVTLPGTGVAVGSPVAVRGRGWETNPISIAPPTGGTIEGPGGSTAAADTCSNSALVLKFVCVDATAGAVKWRVSV